MAIAPNKRSVMTLYTSQTNALCHRIRFVLAEKGVQYEMVDMDTTPDAFIELSEYNPYGSTPTLVDRDLTLYHADVIMEYLDERFPHPPLMPVYPVARARSRLMIYRINRDWLEIMNQILSAKTKAIKANLQKELRESLTSVAQALNQTPFFLSEEFSLVDCCIAPLLWRLPYLGVELPIQAKSILEYADRLFERNAFQASLTPHEITMR